MTGQVTKFLTVTQSKKSIVPFAASFLSSKKMDDGTMAFTTGPAGSAQRKLWVEYHRIFGQLMTIVATNSTNLELKDAKSDPSSASTPRWTPTWSHGCFPENFDTRRGRNVRKSIDIIPLYKILYDA